MKPHPPKRSSPRKPDRFPPDSLHPTTQKANQDKRMFGKAGKAAAIAAIAALALTACGRTDSGSSSSTAGGEAFPKDSLIGVSLPQKTSENWVLAENLFKTDLAGAGFKADVQFANGGVGEQQNQIQSMVT